MTDPVETLRTAAAKLREMAAVATPGPWTLYDRGVCWELNELDEHDGTCFRKGDAHWIATMGPDKAEILAEWLDDSASEVRRHVLISKLTRDIRGELLTAEQIGKSLVHYGIPMDFARSILKDK